MAMKEVVNGEYELAKFLMKSKVELIKDPQERLEAQITYLHILIYLDEYEEALEILTVIQNHFSPSDFRPCLYKVITFFFSFSFSNNQFGFFYYLNYYVSIMFIKSF
ncbi:hypothetical protein IC582_029205 [Cucumis melo]